MTLENLKNQELSVEDRAKELVQALGLQGNERTVTVRLGKGDTFKLVGMNKVELERKTVGFIPVTFTTDGGAQIGARNFAKLVDAPDEMPRVGTTSAENAIFLVWSVDHEVEYKVTKLTEMEVAATDTVPAYIRREYTIQVVTYEELLGITLLFLSGTSICSYEHKKKVQN